MPRERKRAWRAVAAAAALTIGSITAASADQWNERTILTFSSPVMVPGATLEPGEYEFKLADTGTSRQIVQVFADDGQKIVTSMMAVPIKREQPSEDVVVQFNPTERGTPPALKAWFYPGSQYGHELVYSEEDARKIAERSKTVVLSIDTPGTDVEKGVLHTFDPSGVRAEWRGDPATLKEWAEWRQSRAATASAASAETTPEERRQGTAPAIRGDFQATRVELDELESNPSKYISQTISVDGEVEEVLGPRLFTIDERNWGDLDGEILVFMRTPLVALVRDDDRITVTGTVKPFVAAEFEREWGWFGLDPETEVDLEAKPVLVAERIVGGNNNVALSIELVDEGQPVGTSGREAGPPPLAETATVAAADEEYVGRDVSLKNLEVEGTASGGGFFVQSGDDVLFVLPSDRHTTVRPGEMVSVDGVILRLPDRMEERLQAPAGLNSDIYVFAHRIER